MRLQTSLVLLPMHAGVWLRQNEIDCRVDSGSEIDRGERPDRGGSPLPNRKQDAAQVVPALIEALKDKESDVRRSTANGLGSFGEQARDAIPALQ